MGSGDEEGEGRGKGRGKRSGELNLALFVFSRRGPRRIVIFSGVNLLFAVCCFGLVKNGIMGMGLL